MPDLLEGRITLRGYLEKVRGFWWHRVRVDGQPRGLYNLLRQSEFDEALERFEAAYADDPVAACRELYLDLLWPLAQRRGKPGLVEMSSHNVRESQTILRLFPRARIIHALRDGRDSASSVTGKTWGPRSIGAAIGWWADRLRAIEEGVRGIEDGAEFSVPSDHFRVVLLDDLVGHDREATYTGLLAFLGRRGRAGHAELLRGRDDRRAGRTWAAGAASWGRPAASGSSVATSARSAPSSASTTTPPRASGPRSSARRRGVR